MKRKLSLILALVLMLSVVGCTEADRVSSNISKEADNFNIVRQLTVMNCITDSILFQMTGKISIYEKTDPHQLEVTVENGDGTYCKHFVGLSDHIVYVVEDLNLGKNDVEKYKFTLNFNPEMVVPFDVETID